MHDSQSVVVARRCQDGTLQSFFQDNGWQRHGLKTQRREIKMKEDIGLMMTAAILKKREVSSCVGRRRFLPSNSKKNVARARLQTDDPWREEQKKAMEENARTCQ